MTQCINYSKIRDSKTMSEIMVPQCTQKMSGLWNLGLWLFTFYFIFKLIHYITDMRRLFIIRDFYVYLLNIPEDDMQTVTWQDVVARIMALRDHNPKTAAHVAPEARKFMGSQSKERLDASDIANRLMRRENYLIALFNKEVLDLKISVPFLGPRELLSQTLEWALMFSILDFVFDQQGQVNQQFLKADRRREMSAKLRVRFMFAAAMNLILAPFLVCYLVIVYFLMYYQVRLWAIVNDALGSTDLLNVLSRNIRRTRQPSRRGHTRPLRNGSSANSTSFPICLKSGSTCRIHTPRTISTSFPRSRWRWYSRPWPSSLELS